MTDLERGEVKMYGTSQYEIVRDELENFWKGMVKRFGIAKLQYDHVGSR